MEVAMTVAQTVASYRAARPPEGRVSPRPAATLRGLVATWRWRMRFRRELAQKAKHDPHLIDDIGLTRRQVEAEIAKPVWQR